MFGCNNNNNCGCEWIIILIILYFVFCNGCGNNGGNYGCATSCGCN